VVKVRAATDCRGIGPADLIIVLVKSFHTREVIENAGSIIGDETVIISLQNGLGNEEIIGEVVGKKHVMGGRTFAGGSVLAPGHVVASTAGKHTCIGELDGTTTKRAVRIAEEFKRAGLLITVSSNIIGIMWDKLLVNVATGALCGITGLPFGGLYKIPELRDCALEAVAEVMAVAKAIGVKLFTKDPGEVWFKASEGLPEDFKSSILQSLEKGFRTEIDFINGAVVRYGERCKVPTPVNKALVAGIKGIEYRMTHYAKKA
jgi:2-dehydropantoate 2-reductase